MKTSSYSLHGQFIWAGYFQHAATNFKLENALAGTNEIDVAILNELKRRGPCQLEELERWIPCYGWNQLFAAVDRLSRKGILVLKRPTPFDYIVSIGLLSVGLHGAISVALRRSNA